MAITLNGDTGITTPMYNGSITANAVTPSVNMKNRLINGNMTIDQRNAGASVTPTDGQYTLDRWRAYGSGASKYTVQQNAGSVTPPAGFTNYLGVTSSAATTVGSSDYYMIRQTIEGYNVADLDFGKSTAKTVTLSFWVRSSLTGTFGGSLENSAGTYSYPFSYTISSANTWEQKTVTITGQTAGVWNTTNSAGFLVQFSLGVGSTYQGTANAWVNAERWSVTSETQVVATNGATFYITGVQLEVGSTATSFDTRSYGTELQLCQRYYETSYNQSNTAQTVPTNLANSYMFLAVGSNTYGGGANAAQQIVGPAFYKVEKRANPTVTIYSYTSSTTSAVSNGWTGVDLAANTGALGDSWRFGFTVCNKCGSSVGTGGYGVIFGYSASAEL